MLFVRPLPEGYEVLRSACLSVCPLAYLQSHVYPYLTKFSEHATCAVARSSSDDNAVTNRNRTQAAEITPHGCDGMVPFAAE